MAGDLDNPWGAASRAQTPAPLTETSEVDPLVRNIHDDSVGSVLTRVLLSVDFRPFRPILRSTSCSRHDVLNPFNIPQGHSHFM